MKQEILSSTMLPYPNRIRFLLILFMVTVSGLAVAQIKEYVCQPCGMLCDDKVSSKGGMCPDCNMVMVEKSTVKFTNLSPKEFCERMAANPDAIVIDVRSEKEFNGTTTSVDTYGYFKRAININVNQLGKRLSELTPYKNREIFVYCHQSHRSPKAAYYLNLQGFDKVVNMAGGLSKAGSAMKLACFKSQFVAHKK